MKMAECDMMWNGKIKLRDMTDEHLVNAKDRLDEEIDELRRRLAVIKQISFTPSKIKEMEDDDAELKRWRTRVCDEIARRDTEMEDLENV